jgi:antitoxin component YwqK of YwqJK toxin-antitoxin module
MVDYYPGGELRSRSQISNGFLNGVSEAWYINGQMQVREHFKDGVSHGQREKWYENGAKLSLAMIADAKVIGTFRSWHDNGHLSEQIEMKLGRPDGVALAYYPSGFLKAETTVHDGQVQERKVWNDGERKSTP